jgi:glycerate kinase
MIHHESARGHRKLQPSSSRRHILIAPDKFKGSLSASDAAKALAKGLRRVCGDELEIDLCPIADGGEGTLEIALTSGFDRVQAVAEGPTGETVRAAYGERAGVAFVELAEASGLKRLAGGNPAPLTASTYGTGQLIADAIRRGNKTIVLAIGGSATSDGGAGMVQALGAQLLDADGHQLPRGGGALTLVEQVELDGLNARIAGVEFVIATDVDNPLLGPQGAAAVFGPQKGATREHVSILERGLSRWASVVADATGKFASETPGAGAAGGVGFAGISILNAALTSGAEMVLDLVRFSDRAHGAFLVITGEGSLDEQTLHGKGPAQVASFARKAGAPVIAVAGRCTLSDQDLASAGISRAYTLDALEPDVARSMAKASELLSRVGQEIARRELV